MGIEKKRNDCKANIGHTGLGIQIKSNIQGECNGVLFSRQYPAEFMGSTDIVIRKAGLPRSIVFVLLVPGNFMFNIFLSRQDCYNY
jgi:hypothetical protein